MSTACAGLNAAQSASARPVTVPSSCLVTAPSARRAHLERPRAVGVGIVRADQPPRIVIAQLGRVGRAGQRVETAAGGMSYFLPGRGICLSAAATITMGPECNAAAQVMRGRFGAFSAVSP